MLLGITSWIQICVVFFCQVELYFILEPLSDANLCLDLNFAVVGIPLDTDRPSEGEVNVGVRFA